MSLLHTKAKRSILSKETWTFVLLTIFSVLTLVHFVDLTPHVDENFFFSQDDPDYQAEHKISSLFTREDSQLIISAEGDIFSEGYREKVSSLCNILSSLNGVSSVKSITSGPKNTSAAIKSPLWSRLLIPKNKKSTNIIVLLENGQVTSLISKIEHLISSLQSDNFKLRISGFPFIVEQIRSSLLFDLRVFSTLAFLFFAIVIVLIFHSWRILLGMIVACANAYAITFIITELFGIKIGILTANLATIIFVLSLSHIVFLTFNWINIHSTVRDAVIATLPASFWSMFTTILGFSSLLFVKAKPLRELGISGAIGTFIAFIAVYSFYPAFLRLLKDERINTRLKRYYRKSFSLVEKYRRLVILLIIGIVLIASPYLWRLDTNPSLISYFAPHSKITEGLRYVDRNGGSNPLIVVVQAKTQETLDTKKAYQSLWKLQEELENHKNVGSVISLPTLLAEGKRSKFKLFATPKKILKALESPKYNQIAKSFITKDRKNGLFFLRMIDSDRDIHSLEVIDQIKKIVQDHGYEPYLIGGSYALQAQLARHIESSLIIGLGRLLMLFILIALVVSLSLRMMMTMTFSISIIPLCILGGVGFFKIPLDIISAPASNVAIAMGIDFIIHIVYAYRGSKKQNPNLPKRWLHIRKLMWEPIITSMFIICSGFSIFFFSLFPPTQRFGGAIVFGTILSAIISLFIFPLLNRND